jgi:hypothetical protein
LSDSLTDFHLTPHPYFITLDDYHATQPIDTPGELNPAGDIVGLDNQVTDGGSGSIS